jgi:hypothetical protein
LILDPNRIATSSAAAALEEFVTTPTALCCVHCTPLPLSSVFNFRVVIVSVYLASFAFFSLISLQTEMLIQGLLQFPAQFDSLQLRSSRTALRHMYVTTIDCSAVEILNFKNYFFDSVNFHTKSSNLT